MSRPCGACGVGYLHPRRALGFTTRYRDVDVTFVRDFPIRVCDHCNEPSVHLRESVVYGEAIKEAYFARKPRNIGPSCECGALLAPSPEPDCFEDEFVCTAGCDGIYLDDRASVASPVLVFERYNQIVDELREARRMPERPIGSDRERLAMLGVLFEMLTPERQEIANAEGWRSWPDEYDRRTSGRE